MAQRSPCLSKFIGERDRHYLVELSPDKWHSRTEEIFRWLKQPELPGAYYNVRWNFVFTKEISAVAFKLYFG